MVFDAALTALYLKWQGHKICKKNNEVDFMSIPLIILFRMEKSSEEWISGNK